MDDLLKDAIADAKAVRETALENAKIALEEAFTPRLQSMLSKKIQSEIEDEDDIEERGDDEEEMEERGDMMRDDDEDPSDDHSEGSMRDDDEDPSDDHSEAMHDDEEEMEEREDDEDDEPKMDMESVIEIDGVKYAPVVSEEEDEDHDDEKEMDESDEFDLDEILKELEEEKDEDDEPVDESKEEVTEEEELDENDVSSGIGKSDNAHDKKSGDSTDIGKAGKAKHESVEAISEEEDEDDEKKDESVEEDIDLEEIVKALSEEEDEEEKKDENSKLQSELEEHRNVVKYLRSKLNEVNLLNAKLLFTNKLFRSHGLSNDQKMKVVETFDRAHNLREVKLVYSTLAESFGSKQTKTEIKENKKGSASKVVASTKSEKVEVIAEGHEMRDRFKKLAGIL